MAKAMTTTEAKPLTPTGEEEALARRYAGKGISNEAADNIIPQLKILQPLSPEVVGGDSATLNAKAGDFLSADNVVLDGKEGVWFQPCYWDQFWLEFEPLDRGGGFIAQHAWIGYDSGKRAIAPKGATTSDNFHFQLNGHELIHYRQCSGLLWIDKQPFGRVLSFKSTGHTIAKQWMSRAREANREGVDSQPLFGHVWRLTTRKETNNKGTWYLLNVGDAVLLRSSIPRAGEIVGSTLKALELGAATHEGFAGGELRAELDIAPEPQQDEIPF